MTLSTVAMLKNVDLERANVLKTLSVNLDFCAARTTANNFILWQRKTPTAVCQVTFLMLCYPENPVLDVW